MSASYIELLCRRDHNDRYSFCALGNGHKGLAILSFTLRNIRGLPKTGGPHTEPIILLFILGNTKKDLQF